MTVGAALVPSAANSASPPSYSVSVFAPLGHHGTGVAFHRGRVYVSTSDAMALGLPRTGDEYVVTYDDHGRRLDTTNVDMGAASIMGLGNVSFDGSDRLYVSDMKGLIFRYATDGTRMTYAHAPLPYSAGSWTTSMFQGIVFDRAGNGYIPDGAGRIWRVTPAGERSQWFSDPRLYGFEGGGMFQAQLDAAGEWLYFVNVQATEPDTLGGSSLYRVRMTERPGPADLERLHTWPFGRRDAENAAAHHPFVGPETNGVALSRSGRIYVTVSGRNELDVLDAKGNLERTISSPLFNYPAALTFLDDRLLTVNMDIHGEDQSDRPETWNVLSIDVGDSAVAPFLPKNIP